ncbi:MAG: hypothetical protein J0I79_26960 [Mesorhizobium sp.]|uniref:hypothetical protein n=1 Tax=Mesorhizobium sp. TaxID=1871066 RepID=UPI001ACD4B8D|nr:hypothetical protein [Mesorhizobium sp.]MBN9221600.1 hypothetical protein [Mesorhizobium sp.]
MNRSDESTLPATAISELDATFRGSRLPVTVLHLAICLAAIVLTTIAIQLYAYNYKHAWVSSHFAVMARTFNVAGLFDLGLVPVQNNAPLTTSPDAYLHWPPLYPILLALFFRVFGEGVVTHHLSSVALNVASAALIWRSFAGQPDKIAAGLAALTFLGAPIMFHFGFAGLHLHLAIMLTVLALTLFATNTGAAARAMDKSHRRVMLGIGAFAYFSAVMTSWEPLLAAPAFCFFALRDRHRQTTLALTLFGLAAVAALLFILLLYGSGYPHFVERLWNRAMMRSGMSTAVYPPGYTPHDIQDIVLANSAYPWTYYLWSLLPERMVTFGFIGLLGLAGGLASMGAAASLPRPAIAIYLGSLSMFCLWSILMRNHMSIHEYEMLILLPAAASGAGLSFVRFLSRPYGDQQAIVSGANPASPGAMTAKASRRGALACFVAPVLVASLSYMTVRDILTSFTPSSPMIALAELSREQLPDNAIIVTPYPDMVFVYYSGRHVIRSIESEGVLDREQGAILALCPTCSFYLVADKASVDAFPSYKLTKPLAEIPDTGAIWRLNGVLGANRDTGN